jgi:hypothetical protein
MADEQTITDVSSEVAPPPSVSAEAVSAPADGIGSEPTAIEPEAQAPVEEPTEQAEAAFKVPENDDDLKDKINDPHVQAVIQLRQELRQRDQRLDEYKPLENWKPIAEEIRDPVQAQTAYELMKALRTPVNGKPDEFTTRPFLEKADQDRPGVANQLFADLLSFVVPDDKGREDTLVRHLYRSHGLDPDRVEEYRNIDTLRASGVVTSDQLAKIDEKYHEAFKALPQEARDDILVLKETNPILADQYLRNAERSLASEKFEQEQRNRETKAQQEAQAKFEQDTQVAIDNDILAEVKTIHDSIYQNLSSQFTFSSDATQNALELQKIMATLATLQNPAYRFVAEEALKSVGVVLNGFDDLANRWEVSRSKYVAYKQAGQENTWDGREASTEADFAKQQILTKLNDYALRLAKASGERAAAAAAQTEGQLGAATARFVPSGTGQVSQGVQNPYAQNPHPVGSQEYFAFNRNIDKEYKLDNASVFSQ